MPLHREFPAVPRSTKFQCKTIKISGHCGQYNLEMTWAGPIKTVEEPIQKKKGQLIYIKSFKSAFFETKGCVK